MALVAIDIARLVHSYLLKEGYVNSANCLVTECPHLKGVMPLKPPRLLGPSLAEVYNTYIETKDIVLEELDLLKSPTSFKEQDSLPLLTKILLENLKSETSKTRINKDFMHDEQEMLDYHQEINDAIRTLLETKGDSEIDTILDDIVKDCTGTGYVKQIEQGSIACQNGTIAQSSLKCLQVLPVAPINSFAVMSNCNEITVVSVVPNNFQSNKENKSFRRAPIPIAPRPPSCNVDKMPGAADISEGGSNFKTNKTLKRRTGVQTVHPKGTHSLASNEERRRKQKSDAGRTNQAFSIT